MTFSISKNRLLTIVTFWFNGNGIFGEERCWEAWYLFSHAAAPDAAIFIGKENWPCGAYKKANVEGRILIRTE